MAPVATAVGKIHFDDLASITSSDGWSLTFMIDSSFLISMYTQRSFKADGRALLIQQ